MLKTLIVYYSRKGENYYGGGLKKLKKGNTEIAAEYIQKAVGGELFEVDTVKPYSDSYHKCTEEAKAELSANARPEPKSFADGVDAYDAIFVCYPNWWGTMPMVMWTFLEHYNLTGKKIIPLCTNEGSGMGVSEHDLKKICKGADVKTGLAVRGSETENSENRIADWAKKSLQA